MTNETDHKPKKSVKKALIENFVSLGVAVFVVFMIRSSVVEAFKIPSGSMIPTLLIGDHIFVNKFSYGLKVPFTEWFMDEPVYLFGKTYPNRGDIIVFKFPHSPPDETTYFIKRVIGVPGDVISVKDKVLYVNNKVQAVDPIPAERQKAILDEVGEAGFHAQHIRIFEENLDATNGSRKHLMMTDAGNLGTLEYGPITVPNGSVFVMGDNRDHSNDSRYWGLVPQGNIKGRAFVIWLSAWINLDKWDYTFKPARIGTILR